MHIALIDDSIPFDGTTPSRRPLDGAEKAFASLPGALARRGHEVTVVNRCHARGTVDGALWLPWEAARPERADVLIAFRKPALLDQVAAPRLILWLSAPAGYLDRPANRKLVERHRPDLVFLGRAHRKTWSGRQDLRCHIISPGLGEAFLSQDEAVPDDPPYAVFTAHPRLGLDKVLEAWVERIRPAIPEARLRVYSAVLERGRSGGAGGDDMRALLDKAMAAGEHGVRIERPRPDPGMAEAYRAARLHLYPRTEVEMYCATLAESQACGLPAVALRGAAAGEFRNDVDPVQLYITIAAASYFYHSNAHTLSAIFDRDLLDEQAIKAREAHVVEVIMGYLRPADQ